MRQESFLSARAFPARVAVLVIILSGLAVAAPGGAAMNPPQFPGFKKDKGDDKNAPKNLTGQVVDKEGKGLAQAVIYLKDKRTLEVKTHISDERGNYRFSGLDPNTDYEVHAEFKGASSSKRSASSFDGRKEVYLVLEIGTPP